MVTNQKPPFESTDPEQEAQRAEIAVGDPKVSQTDRRQHLIQQRAFLSMTVTGLASTNFSNGPLSNILVTFY